ncbi:WIZ protein, partial [Sylvia borin]|nr:WIZ protein [Sylvia borin]
AVPRAALELKRTFRSALSAADAAATTEDQRRQLRHAVPLVLLHDVSPSHEATKKPRLQSRRGDKKHRQKRHRQRRFSPGEDFLRRDPLDVLLLESPLETPLELEELLGAEAAVLKNEERRCPYCPDRFHNGIGLANHVRGHLNRVGVSYNVRHFISAEEVKAIEQ